MRRASRLEIRATDAPDDAQVWKRDALAFSMIAYVARVDAIIYVIEPCN